MPSAPTVFVDSNVFVYAHDARDAHKQRRAREWLTHCWLRHCGRTSTQVIHEVAWVAGRKLQGVDPERVREGLRRLKRWAPVPVDFDLIESAWEIQLQFRLSQWDSLVVAAARRARVDCLLTEDLQHGQRIETLRIVNPFLVAPEEL